MSKINDEKPRNRDDKNRIKESEREKAKGDRNGVPSRGRQRNRRELDLEEIELGLGRLNSKQKAWKAEQTKEERRQKGRNFGGR